MTYTKRQISRHQGGHSHPGEKRHYCKPRMENEHFNVITDNEALAVEIELQNRDKVILATIYCPNIQIYKAIPSLVIPSSNSNKSTKAPSLGSQRRSSFKLSPQQNKTSSTKPSPNKRST